MKRRAVYLYESGIRTTVETVDVETLPAAIEHVEGDRYDLRKIEDTEDALTKLLGEKGLLDIRARTRRDRENNLIRVEYVIEEGPRACRAD